jgi:hypothetical protein
MFTVNISSVKRFHQCRARWLIEWHLNRVPREGALPLNLGKLVHVAFEKYLLNQSTSMLAAIDATLAEWTDTIGKQHEAGLLDDAEFGEAIDAAKALNDLREPLALWKDQFPVQQVLEVEEPFEFPHPLDNNIIVRGRPDRMAVVYGKLVHIQNRTLAAGVNFGLYTELAKRDYHELVYAWAMQLKYPHLKYGGTLMNLIRKLKYRGVPTKACPEGKILHTTDEMFGQFMVPMLDKQVHQAMNDLLYDVMDMQACITDYETNNVMPSPNRQRDGGPYGNKKDPYFDVFMGKVDINDDKFFKPREDMYTPVTDES